MNGLLLLLGVGVGGYLLYQYSQKSATTVPTATAAQLQPQVAIGGTSIVNQAANAAANYANGQLSALFDTDDSAYS